jgi:hypothetical protein
MRPEEFILWLEGYLDGHKGPILPENGEEIRRKLEEVMGAGRFQAMRAAAAREAARTTPSRGPL